MQKKEKEELLERIEYDEFEGFCCFLKDECKMCRFKNEKIQNHEFVGGKLIQTNKKFSQLKEKQNP